jgi:hypothetical protein
MKSGLFFLLALMACISACKKPVDQSSDLLNESAPIIFYTSLKDTLPEKTFNEIKVNVIGLKIRDLNGSDVRYFEYQCDPGKLLHALSNSSFHLNSENSALSCGPISKDDLISNLEKSFGGDKEYRARFGDYDPNGYEAFECIKLPLIHHVLVNRLSGKIIHRVEKV